MLGLIYAIIAFGFALIWVVSILKSSYIYNLIGKYGFILMIFLALIQGSIDYGYLKTPNTVGDAILLLSAILILFLIVDTLYFIILILPRKKRGDSWEFILFGRVK